MALRIKTVTGLCVALTLVALGCSDSDDEAFPPINEIEGLSTESTASTVTTTETTEPPITETSSTTTEPVPEDSVPDPSEGEAFDAYIAGRIQAFYEVRDRAFADPSPTPETDYPELAELSAEPQLSVMQDAIRELHADGQAYRELADSEVGTTTDDEHRVSGVQTVEGDKVTAFDCEVNDDDIVEVSTGDVVIAGTLTILRVNILELSEGTWKVTGSEVSQKIEGVAGCYLASEREFPY